MIFIALTFSGQNAGLSLRVATGARAAVFWGAAMAGGLPLTFLWRGRRLGSSLCLAVAPVALTNCAGGNSEFYSNTPPQQSPASPPASTLGEGQVRVALILPLSGPRQA